VSGVENPAVADGPAPGALAAAFLRLDADRRAALLEELTGEELVQLEADVDEQVRSSLEDWCRLALADEGQAPALHHRLLLRELEDIAAGENDRLMVQMPPGTAKSRYVSDLFPPWFMARQRGTSVIGASHTSGLAQYFSRKVLGRIRQHGATLRMHLRSEGVESWETTNGSEYRAAGVGAAIAGRRADLVLIDDPVKSREEADNLDIRNRTWEWYQGDVIGRLKPTGRIVLIMTRWHEDDLAGRLLDLQPGRWRTLALPALAEADDPLGREPGTPLWPEYWPLEKWLAKQAEAGGPNSREWNSQYQQRPASATGALFQVTKLAVHDDVPSLVRRVRAWDLAATEAGATVGKKRGADPDWTVGVLLGKTTAGRFVVLDVARVRGGPEVVERTIVETARADGAAVTIGLPQDPGQAGKWQGSYLTAQLAGYVVQTSLESGSKTTRAMPVSSQCNGGNLGIMRAPWNAAFVDELRNFPAGRFDDQVDALSRGFAMLLLTAKPAHGRHLGFMAR